MVDKRARVLIVGESVYKIHTHFKGFASYETGYATLSLDPFLDRFKDSGFVLDFMPNQDISLRFPASLEEMRKWDAIVISDAPADSFLLHPDTLDGAIMPNRLKLICDYVRGGRGFAMIGGWMAFGGFHGKAHYAYTPLADLLPVRIAPHDDRMETPEGISPEVVADHSLLDGISREWPDFLGYNKVEARAGKVLLQFQGTRDPLLIVDEVGSGRVACFTSDILPHWGSPRFTAWRDYVPFWERFFRWLAKADGEAGQDSRMRVAAATA
jgi:uncharacterized membrane protein